MNTPKNLKEQLEALGAVEGDDFVDDNGNEWMMCRNNWLSHKKTQNEYGESIYPYFIIPGLRRKPKFKKVEFWVNYYFDKSVSAHITKQEAEETADDVSDHIDSQRIACHRFEIEVPE